MAVLSSFTRPIAAAALAAVVVLGLAACGASPAAGDQPRAHDALIILASAHSNAPAADIPVTLQPIIVETIAAGAPVTIIAVDGTPQVVLRIAGYAVSTANPIAAQNDIDGIQADLLAAVREVAADADGNDLAAAFGIAADQARADGAERAAIISIDSGLSDRGFPDLAAEGATSTDPAVIVAHAEDNAALPTMPPGTVVYAVGFGYGAGPQPALPAPQRERVTDIWEAWLEAAGATVAVIPAPRSGPAPTTSHVTRTVAPVEIPPLAVTTTSSGIRAGLGGDVLFDTGSAELRQDAEPMLDQLRQVLVDTSGPILVEGHTDDVGDAAQNQALSSARARSVAAWLVAHSIDAARITTQGLGETEPLIPDARTASQHQQNRRVVITVTR